MEKGPVFLKHGIKVTGFRKILMFPSLDHLFLVTMPAMNSYWLLYLMFSAFKAL